jgi:hypothetical protein
MKEVLSSEVESSLPLKVKNFLSMNEDTPIFHSQDSSQKGARGMGPKWGQENTWFMLKYH